MKNRLIWAVSIFLAAVLYLFENNPGTLTLLVGVLVVPILGLIPLLGEKIALNVEIRSAQEKGSIATGTLTVTNPGILPLPAVKMVISCRNLRTGEFSNAKVAVALLPRQSQSLSFQVECPYCGKVEILVGETELSDVFGLFSRSVPQKAVCYFTVVPQLFAPEISLESQGMAMPDSDTYSGAKPGSDPGETFAIREYVPGDAIRQIHWKLSEKTDKLMVRQFGLPVVHEVALLLETAAASDFDEADAVTEVFASVSSALIGAGVPHHVFWQDSTGELAFLPITSEDEFAGMLEQLLELPPREDGSGARVFTQNHPHCPYSHVIVVGGQIPQGVRDLYNGNRVSLLIPHRDSIPEGLQPDGTRVFSFTPECYAAELCRMEV